MQFVIKLALAVLIIVLCAQIARARPTLAGLIAVMPLTGLIVMLWVYSDCQGDAVRMGRYTWERFGEFCRLLCFSVRPICVFAKECRWGGYWESVR